MTKPSLIRDADGGQWAMQADGTYNLRTSHPYLRGVYQGYTISRIDDEFGVIGKTYDTPSGDQDYSFLRR